MSLPSISSFFFFNDTATTEIYTLSLHDALPICGFVDVDHAAFGVARRGEADHRSFTGHLAEAKNIGQNRRCLLSAVEQQGDALKAADRMFGGDVAVAPARLILRIDDADKRECHPVLVRERQDGFAKTRLRRLMRNSLLDEAVRPVAD